jgi:hypothetical protein
MDDFTREVETGLRTETHNSFQVWRTEFNHDGIRVTVDDFSVVTVAI